MDEPQQSPQRGRWAWIRSVPKTIWAAIGAIGVVTGAVLGVMGLVELLGDVGKDPIRTSHFFQTDEEATIVGGIDSQEKDLDSYELAYPSARVLVSVTSRVEDETVTLAPYLVIEVTKLKPMPKMVDYAIFPANGAGGTANHFVATLAPEREGVFYAPQLTNDTEPPPLNGDSPVSNLKVYDYFTLTPGETENFVLSTAMLPGYYYYRVGVQYSYKGDHGVHWIEREFVVGEPLKGEVWAFIPQAKGGTRAEKYEDLPKCEDIRSCDYAFFRHSEREIQNAIKRQDAAIREYDYPFTPPEQLDGSREN